MTNDITQLASGIRNLILHISEILHKRNFTSKAVKRHLVEILVDQIKQIVDKDDDSTYILLPILPLAADYIHIRAIKLGDRLIAAKSQGDQEQAKSILEIVNKLLAIEHTLRSLCNNDIME